jgi:ubiquinone/menaquinone biosynthesis C-methylase UbiE
MKNPIDILFARDGRVCPWWLCFTFDNPIRKLIHNQNKILSPYVQSGSTAIDIGPGMGYFTVPLCRLVGEKGRVIAVDIQSKMLTALEKRAKRAGVSRQLTTHLGALEGMGIKVEADFVLTFWMVHEVPNQAHLFREIRSILKDGGTYLLVEPVFHVNREAFARTVEAASGAGFKVKEKPRIALSRSVLLTSA